jgi:hypothetical protein
MAPLLPSRASLARYASDQGRTRVTRDEEVFPCESSEIAGTVGDDPRGVDARAREVAPRVPSRALADPPGASTWRGGDDECRQVGSLVSGQ